MADKRSGKYHQRIDKHKVIQYLNREFQRKTRHMGKNATKGTKLHVFQVDFCYLIQGISTGYGYQISKNIADANTFLDNILVPA